MLVSCMCSRRNRHSALSHTRSTHHSLSPFGDDPNDLDDLGMAQLVFEDIYISIYKLDGDQAAYQLRRKIVARIKKGTALDNFQEDYQHGYSPTQEDDVIAYDRRLEFQQAGSTFETPFYKKSKQPPQSKKKKRSGANAVFKNVSIPKTNLPSLGKKGKK